MEDAARIDPWSSEQSTDYARIRDQFGLESIDISRIPNPSMLHRRGIIFAHRDLDVVTGCMERSDPFGVLTGPHAQRQDASRSFHGYRASKVVSGTRC